MSRNRKRGLSDEEIQRLLAESSSDSDSDVDSDVDTDSSSDGDDGAESDSSQKTVDYNVPSAFGRSDQDAFHRARFAFTGTAGCKAAIADTQDVLEYFNLYFTDEIMDAIVMETNRRAQQLIQAVAATRRTGLNNWIDTTRDELRVLFALFVYQGIIHKPEVAMYWSTKPLWRHLTSDKLCLRNAFLYYGNACTLLTTLHCLLIPFHPSNRS